MNKYEIRAELERKKINKQKQLDMINVVSQKPENDYPDTIEYLGFELELDPASTNKDCKVYKAKSKQTEETQTL